MTDPRNPKTINFNSVAAEAGVSKGFLYKHEEFRERIEYLRRQQEGLPSKKQVRRTMSDASKDVMIESLRKRISDLEEENKKLKKQLQNKLSDVYAKI